MDARNSYQYDVYGQGSIVVMLELTKKSHSASSLYYFLGIIILFDFLVDAYLKSARNFQFSPTRIVGLDRGVF